MAAPEAITCCECKKTYRPPAVRQMRAIREAGFRVRETHHTDVLRRRFLYVCSDHAKEGDW